MTRYSLLNPALPSSAPAFQILRLLSLQTDPIAFLSDYQTEKMKSLDLFAQELVFASLRPPFGYYGCWVDDQLVGYLQFGSTGLTKQTHIGFMYNLFFHPNFRRQHLAAELVDHVKNIARSAGIEKIFATCIAGNQPALQFYQKLGFVACGHRPGSVKWQNHYDDEIELVLVVK